MLIAPGTASQRLAKELAKLTGARLLDLEIKRFPDNECYVRALKDVEGEKVVVVNTAYPDQNIVETLLLQDAVRDEADEVATIIPYLSYSRQDKKFQTGEALSARAVIRALSRHTDHFAVVNLHKESVIEYSLSKGHNISPYNIISDFLSGLPKPPDMIMGPDKGARHIASSVAGLMGVDWDHMKKHRIDDAHVEIALPSSSVKGKIVAIVDDIISTGETIAKATSKLKEGGAIAVYAVCTHGLFIGEAKEKLDVCDLIASTDTIETGYTRFSAAPALAYYLKGIGFV